MFHIRCDRGSWDRMLREADSLIGDVDDAGSDSELGGVLERTDGGGTTLMSPAPRLPPTQAAAASNGGGDEGHAAESAAALAAVLPSLHRSVDHWVSMQRVARRLQVRQGFPSS